MAKLGLIGGIGPASTIEYYRDIIDGYRKATGGHCYPEITIESIDMGRFFAALEGGEPEEAQVILLNALYNLALTASDFCAISCNTAHLVLGSMTEKSPLPVLSIIDAVRDYIKEGGYKRVLLLGSGFTLKQGLYTEPLEGLGAVPITPQKDDIDYIESLIFPNLENGIVLPEDKLRMIELIERYVVSREADSVLLGCTEIPLMIKPEDVSVPVIDTAKVHIDSIIKVMLKK